MKYGELQLLAFVDFSKAFDTIAHDTLIMKMNQQGVSKEFLSSTTSCFTSHKQFAQIAASSSDSLSTKFGVPQGFILGPMIFNLYVNDLQNHFKSSSVQYADHPTIYETCKPKEIQKAQYLLNKSLAKVTDWTNNNSLAANAIKTKYILYASNRLYDFHQLKDQEIGITVGSTKLKLDKKARYLGVYLDPHLTRKAI